MPLSTPRILIYVLRRDLRLADNPIFHHVAELSNSGNLPFTHVLPLYVLPAHQIEVSGFLQPGMKSPYPEARSCVAGFWRCGPHRAKFLAESVWDLKKSLGVLGSDLIIRVGMVGDVLRAMLSQPRAAESPSREGNGDIAATTATISAIWMTQEEGVEEKREERDAREAAASHGVSFRLWTDEKFFVDDRDLPFTDIKELPDIYTNFRKSLEPLRSQPRKTAPAPTCLPPLPPDPHIAPQTAPFTCPDSLSSMIESLNKPLDLTMGSEAPPQWPSGTESMPDFVGGEMAAHARISHLISSGVMFHYNETRNGLLGQDYSTRLSAWLALGCVTARQIHASLLAYEDGSPDVQDTWKTAPGYGQGENRGTNAVRFELLWRDYMRLCTRKYGARLFHVDGFRSDKAIERKKRWHYLDRSCGVGDDPARTRQAIDRFRCGRTGIGLIDASQRELFLTGYTSNRARQNVASFLASHLGIDWRVGAEWYEYALVDYDLSNNWGNWQYVAGVGNDPRKGRIFNPVKQALDYDIGGAYIKAWVEELRDVDVDGAQSGGQRGEEMLMGLFQAWRLPQHEKERLQLTDIDWVKHPLLRIPFDIRGKARGRGRGDYRQRGGPSWGRGRGGHAGLQRLPEQQQGTGRRRTSI